MKVLSGVIFLLVALGCSTPAAALGLHICNQTGTTVWVATAMWDSAPFPGVSDSFCQEKGDCTKTQGWWKLESGQCATPYPGNMDISDAQGDHVKYLYYAHDNAGAEWTGQDTTAGGDVKFCIDQAEFSFDSQLSVKCPDSRWKPFNFIAAGNDADHTSNITSRKSP